MIRRFVLAVGAALLVGGWGAIRYADAQRSVAEGFWMERTPEAGPPGKDIQQDGTIAMALGAAMLAGAWTRQRVASRAD